MTSLVSTKVLFLFVLAPLLTTGQFACSSDNDGTTGGEGGASTGVPLQCSNSDGLQIISLAAGSGHTCAVTSNGGVRCWGMNQLGQLGDGTTNDRWTPPMSDVLTGVKAIAAAAGSTCALMDAGGVRCWGENNYGQLGDGTSTYRSTPPSTDVLTGVRAIAAGGTATSW